jgi:hypothetical protein
MFGQLLLNKNKITTVWRDIYYIKFASKFWNLHMPLSSDLHDSRAACGPARPRAAAGEHERECALA